LNNSHPLPTLLIMVREELGVFPPHLVQEWPGVVVFTGTTRMAFSGIICSSKGLLLAGC
jgi:hypothetical protein